MHGQILIGMFWASLFVVFMEHVGLLIFMEKTMAENVSDAKVLDLGGNSLFDTMLKSSSLFDIGKKILPYLTLGLKFVPYMTLSSNLLDYSV
jgi:hypothetical protein